MMPACPPPGDAAPWETPQARLDQALTAVLRGPLNPLEGAVASSDGIDVFLTFEHAARLTEILELADRVADDLADAMHRIAQLIGLDRYDPARDSTVLAQCTWCGHVRDTPRRAGWVCPPCGFLNAPPPVRCRYAAEPVRFPHHRCHDRDQQPVPVNGPKDCAAEAHAHMYDPQPEEATR